MFVNDVSLNYILVWSFPRIFNKDGIHYNETCNIITRCAIIN